jgi:phosphoglycerate dehydrogenase-like enzyme
VLDSALSYTVLFVIEIILIGNIARCGARVLAERLRIPHRLVEYHSAVPLDGAEVFVGSPVTASMIAAAPKLRLVQVPGAGLDAVDLNALPPRVALCNAFHHERAIAEYAIMTMLALERDLFRQDRNLRAGHWESSCITGPPTARELAGRPLGIIGFGHIGRETARLAEAFEMKIVSIGSRGTRAELENLLKTSHHVLIACPLTEQTRGLIGGPELALMRPDACLIQVARGEIIDEQALYDALSSRRIRGAAIDVWYQYPRHGKPCLPSRFPFHELDNVILTPHSSAWTDRVLEGRFTDTAENIERLVRGEPLRHMIRG